MLTEAEPASHPPILSYSRRGHRLPGKLQKFWDESGLDYLLELDELQGWLANTRNLVVEIGSGNGEVVADIAAKFPETDYLIIEVWRPGVAATIGRLAEAQLSNVKILMTDAKVALALFPAASIAELWTFFPDPWPKKRHHKRRLLTTEFADFVAPKLAKTAIWRLATDWPDYANQIGEQFAQAAALSGGQTERWELRPISKFERRGIAESRGSTDFTYFVVN